MTRAARGLVALGLVASQVLPVLAAGLCCLAGPSLPKHACCGEATGLSAPSADCCAAKAAAAPDASRLPAPATRGDQPAGRVQAAPHDPGPKLAAWLGPPPVARLAAAPPRSAVLRI